METEKADRNIEDPKERETERLRRYTTWCKTNRAGRRNGIETKGGIPWLLCEYFDCEFCEDSAGRLWTRTWRCFFSVRPFVPGKIDVPTQK
jgi:hypothetical protein